MKIRIAVAALILLLAGSIGFAEQENFNSVIYDLDVRGNEVVKEKTILEAVDSKVLTTVSESQINNDIKKIFSLGYFENVTVSYEPYKKGKRIVFVVKENPLIKKILVSGNSVYSTGEVKTLMSLKEGEILNYKLLRSDIDAIQGKYQKDGYIMAKVTDVKADPESEKLYVDISEGRIEGITIEGNTNTKDWVILRELNSKAGKVFNEKTLKADLRRIFNLGYFTEVNPEFVPGKEKNSLLLNLNIKEAKTSTINFGGGYGEREGWFGFTDLSVNNIFGTAQNVLLKGQAGQQVSTYQFKYYNPWFWPQKLGPRTSLTARIWNTMGRDIYLTLQDEYHMGWDMAIGKDLNEQYKSSFSFGSEAVSPRNNASFEAYLSNFIGYSLSFDTRDVWMNPTNGAYHTLSLKLGWKHANSAVTTYSKYGLDLNRFYTVRENTVYAWHIGGGYGVGDIPLGEEYWAGSPNTVRGYGLDEIKKGTRLFLINNEIRYTFNETLQGVVFFDWGNAWNTGLPVFSDFIAGWGPGVRLNTPLGPIRLDYGMPTSKPFGTGMLQFSIGQAF
ncbi:hypothetical protein A2276_01550 [candidate division WOR-1 bacterium RIFOXYA12_FULL_43_27]|uniref:POTRA domain-containing protein n=1 Tax=candidate division WOR-1 bacterium RIFOXYC2_FULL_46_14 TaxID=1802587 RepID=A0A1F4U6Q3_UNCSA|nr:MAG: hypothetical protein A2276_01550 [candidate division WOR-1 bacterium RIFOXYA12_FULL_43_27]OGC19589.1 MAG: hypothetical protein A2292_02780 [candidate division WOR-1 bacterium RIFOXYB2_FULL_46_45]OGC30578.1 MAG: hypothetical protein A2232_02780 [candidate division WOR-1 bacterium RIFOXYA2_FULL_46_56]OGC40645.1 MAG: hypothetical protein A2438_06495 [candidate division WOR-1 bacterium RIFOXYC2_FULL_46_14]